MGFAVTRTSRSLVAPSSPTPSETLPLSVIDRVMGLRHLVRSLHVFNGDVDRKGEPARVVREALGKALVDYYPFAGRFVEEDGDLMVACTGEGAWFVEATAACTLEEVNHLDHPMAIPKEELLPEQAPDVAPLDLPLMMQENITTSNTSSYQTERIQRAALLRNIIFNLDPRNRRTSSPQALTSRICRQLRRAGTATEDGPSAGGVPRATSAPDPGPAPLHLHGGGRIFHLYASSRRSSSLQSSPQTSKTPTAKQPPPPEEIAVEQGSSHPSPSKTTPGARGGCSPAKRRRKPPHHGPDAQDPPYPHPIYTAGTRIRGFPILPPPERPAEGGKSHGCAGERWSSRGRPRVASRFSPSKICTYT